MSKTVRVSGSLLLVFALFASLSHAADKVSLKLRLKEKQSYSIRMTLVQKITQSSGGEEQVINQKMRYDYTFDVKKIDEGGIAAIKVTYDSVLWEQQHGKMSLKYDSSQPPEELPLQAIGFASLVDSGFVMTMSPDGRVGEVKGMDALIDDMLTKMAGAFKKRGRDIEQMLPEMRENLKKQFGDKVIRESMEQMVAVYPEKPVSVGDSWSRKIISTVGYQYIIENTWKLTGRKEGLALIDVNSAIRSNPDAEPLKMGAITMKADLKGSQTGTLQMAEATGWTSKAAIEQKVAGKLTLKGVPGGPDEVEVPIRIETTLTIESGPKADAAEPKPGRRRTRSAR